MQLTALLQFAVNLPNRYHPDVFGKIEMKGLEVNVFEFPRFYNVIYGQRFFRLHTNRIHIESCLYSIFEINHKQINVFLILLNEIRFYGVSYFYDYHFICFKILLRI